MAGWIGWRQRDPCPACRRLPCVCEEADRRRAAEAAERARVAEEGRSVGWERWVESTGRLAGRPPSWAAEPGLEDAPGATIRPGPWRCPACDHEAPMPPAWCQRCGAVG